MSDMFEHTAHLSEEIGPRPAGTEEERQAALYLAEAFQRKAGLQSQVEDFTCPVDFELPRAMLCGISVVMTVLSIVLTVLVIPAFIVTLVTAVLYCVESLVKPVIARAISHGASQNVVARYEPNEYVENSPARHRKVILVSHYDSGKVRRELSGSLVGALPIVRWAELVAMVVVPLLLLIRLIFIPTGAFSVVMNVLSIIAIILCLLPVVITLIHRSAPYNEGANCNASGPAVLLEVAKRVREGREKALAEAATPGARVHGAAAAEANGLVPEGAELVYETGANADEEASAEDRLMAAKAAVAMMTGKPVSASVNIDLDEAEDDAIDEAALAARNAVYVANELEGAEVSPNAQQPLTVVGLGADSAAAGQVVAPDEAAYAGENSTDQAPVTFMPKAAQAAAATAASATPAPASEAPATVAFTSKPEEPALPEWFTAARAKAKQNGADLDDGAPVQRSRYAEAAEMAQREIDARMEAERAEAEAQTTPTDTEARLQEMRAAIIENYPTSSEAAAAAAKKAAEAGEAEEVHPEAATTAFAPVKIDGDQLKAEAASQAENDATKQVVVQGATETAEPSAPAASAAAAPAAPAVTPPAAVEELQAQRAAQAAKLQSILPPLAQKKEQPSEEQRTRQASLRMVLPSLSGSIKAPETTLSEEAEDERDDETKALDSLSDSFSPVTATAVFSAVDGDDYEEIDEEFADDVDDEGFEASAVESTGLVEMPKSRAGRLFGRFRRNKKAKDQDETSAHEWLDVDDDFDARSVGEARGGWESFREDYEEDDFNAFDDDGYDDFEEAGFRPRGWNGGAFSAKGLGKVRGMASRLKRGGDDEADVADDAIPEADVAEGEEVAYEEPAAAPAATPRRTRRSQAHSFVTEESEGTGEMKAIRDFHDPNIEVEVWFVALGAELAGNGGTDAFLAAHREELKGAIFVDVEALGAGQLTLIDEEGLYFPAKASSRMERYSRKAAAGCGMHIDRAKMLWKNSSAVALMRNGIQAMHLAGMMDGKPAFAAQRNDTMDVIEESTLERNADFIIELLRSI